MCQARRNGKSGVCVCVSGGGGSLSKKVGIKKGIKKFSIICQDFTKNSIE